MKIDLFKNTPIFKNVLNKDDNNREINIYKTTNVCLTGHSIFYPNVLLKTETNLILPLLERTMSLKSGTIYEKQNMEYDYMKNELKDKVHEPLFFFIYNTDNYFHFLYDTLPYLISFFELRKEIPNLKLLMQLPNPQKTEMYRFVLEFLQILNITKQDIILANTETEYSNIYISTSYTHDIDSNLPPRKEIFNFYKKIVNIVKGKYGNKSTPQKIYISRRTWLHNDFSNIETNYTTRRKLVNEDELVDRLVNEGYKEVFAEKLTTIEKIQYFSNATHVMGAIGGGLANVLFSPNKTKLKAIVSPTFLDVNKRFKFCLDSVDVDYDMRTNHTENTEFKTYMRVKTKDGKIVGEIEKIYGNKLLVSYTDGSNTGWNSQSKYKKIELAIDNVEKLDNGLNSPWKIFNYDIKIDELYMYHSFEDIPIKLKNGTNIHENVFLFDCNKNIKTTFLCDIMYKNLNINFDKFMEINEICFLFYSNSQEKAYGHHMKELLIRLDYIFKLQKKIKDIKIIMPRKYYYNNTQYLFEKFNLTNKLIFLDDKKFYKFDKVIFLPQNNKFELLLKEEIFSLNKIRKILNIKKNVNPTKKLYIQRNNIESKKTGCYNIGFKRKIINELELINYLKKNGFEIIKLWNKSIEEKSMLLNNSEIIITQMGGNIFNLLFSNTPKKILFLSNEYPILYNYICCMLNCKDIIESTKTNFKIIKYKTIINYDKENSTNGCFEVKINDIDNFIKS